MLVCFSSLQDAHSFILNFNNTPGAGWFAVFDGHAGKSAAEFSALNVHEVGISFCIHLEFFCLASTSANHTYTRGFGRSI